MEHHFPMMLLIVFVCILLASTLYARYPIGFDVVVNRFFILGVPMRPRSAHSHRLICVRDVVSGSGKAVGRLMQPRR
jgi:hypothetical protein